MIPDEELILVDVTSKAGVESYLASLWRRLLDVEHVGADDNFFELGGDSLIAMELLAIIDDTLDADIPITTLYERPTIAELSEYIVGLGSL